MPANRSICEKPPRPRSQGRPSLAEAATIRLDLRSAAMAALLEHGDGATMNGIAQRAGISRKALYARYSSRSDLFADVIRGMLAEVEPLPVASDGPVRQRLAVFIDDMLALLAHPQVRAVQRLIALDPLCLSGLRDEMHEATSKMFFDPLLGLIEQAIGEGLVRRADPETVARVVLRMIFSQALFDAQAEVPDTDTNGTAMVSGAVLVREIILDGLLCR